MYFLLDDEDASGNCPSDYVTVSENGKTEKFCGKGWFLHVYTFGNTVQISIGLHSTGSAIPGQGFSLVVTTSKYSHADLNLFIILNGWVKVIVSVSNGIIITHFGHSIISTKSLQGIH